VDGKTLARQVEGGTGAGNQSSSILHFGLSDATTADKLTIIWPSGKTTELSDVAADQLLEILED
jgi:enediyne biosynthesis protein E4